MSCLSNYFKPMPWVVLLVFLACLEGQAQRTDLAIREAWSDPPELKELTGLKEEFTYEVKYSFFKLGEVIVEVLSDTTYEGKRAWHLKTVIRSNPGIPFVGKEENHYNSIFMESDSMPVEHIYWRDNVDEEEFRDVVYRFDREKQKVYGRMNEVESDTFDLEPGGNSGHPTFVTSRLYAGSDTTIRMPIYIDMNHGYLTINNTTDIESREYEAFENPVETFYTEGQTTIEGPFGFKGSFKAWFLTDAMRVPLEAHVRVWLGHVKIRLTDYKKQVR